MKKLIKRHLLAILLITISVISANIVVNIICCETITTNFSNEYLLYAIIAYPLVYMIL